METLNPKTLTKIMNVIFFHVKLIENLLHLRLKV